MLCTLNTAIIYDICLYYSMQVSFRMGRKLWCVYEWVCGLLIHSAMEIEILADPFIRDSTVDTWRFR